MTRKETKVINIGGRKIGGGNPVAIQSMTNTKTEDVEATVAQILALEKAGCEIIRCAVPTMEAAQALKEIKKQIHIPLVADIHFDYRLAIAAIENGADKIRINPGNIGSEDRVRAVVEKAKEYEIPVTLLCDTNHVLYSDYSEVVTVGAGADAVDFKLVSLCHKGDIVVTQDYGVAAMILGKGAYGIHQNGKWYTNENIDQMLMERHLNKKARRASGKNHLKGPRKRTSEDDEHFRESFEKMIHMAMDKEN